VPESISKATHVVAVSESTKLQIISNYGTNPNKISVVEPALMLDEYKPAQQEEVTRVKAKYGITKEYLLFLGTIEPRKNIECILNAYIQLPKSIQKSYQIVLAGGKGWLDEEIDQISAQIDSGSIVRTGYVDHSEKPALYTGAKLFLYPSHYEGWGMQILESMACGTPVITARNSSLPEAGGEAAAYVEGSDPTELAQLIQDILYNPTRMMQMRRDGLERAKNFTWSASARKMADVIKYVRGIRAN
jgi:glycosyltransferase involved in cell wall biosynthesis